MRAKNDDRRNHAYHLCISQKLVETVEQKAHVYYRLGWAYHEDRQWDTAVLWYSKLIALNRYDWFDANASCNRGSLLYWRKQYPAALADINRAISIYDEPEDLASSYFERSKVYRVHSLELSDIEKRYRLRPIRKRWRQTPNG